jgi:hypothetical protein
MVALLVLHDSTFIGGKHVPLALAVHDFHRAIEQLAVDVGNLQAGGLELGFDVAQHHVLFLLRIVLGRLEVAGLVELLAAVLGVEMVEQVVRRQAVAGAAAGAGGAVVGVMRIEHVAVLLAELSASSSVMPLLRISGPKPGRNGPRLPP